MTMLATMKKLTNHSARRTLIKTLKKKQVPKCDIITITGHTTEAGLDAYDSGDEAQQEAISLAIDNIDVPINRNAMSTTNNTTTKNILNQSQFFISPIHDLKTHVSTSFRHKTVFILLLIHMHQYHFLLLFLRLHLALTSHSITAQSISPGYQVRHHRLINQTTKLFHRREDDM